MAMIQHQIRVRYAETDQMRVAHHASYVPWLEEARIESMRSLGMSYDALEQRGIGMPVIDMHVSYKRSVRFDDIIDMHTHVEIVGRTRIIFHTDIYKDEVLCARAAITVACVGATGAPVRIPSDVALQLGQATPESAQQSAQRKA